MILGQTLDHYVVEGQLGAGGMGTVYRATDTRLGRTVALKLLHADLSNDPETAARLDREARLLAALNHPNIAAIYGLEEAGSLTFLVLEHVPGATLAERLASGPLPLRAALSVGLQIADALEAAHERGIVHRDLKPANIKITDDDKVKLLDFGVAKTLERAPAMQTGNTITGDSTIAGVVLGTAPYMSPEQACGKPLDTRTDVWSFGCVLFEALTGSRASSSASLTGRRWSARGCRRMSNGSFAAASRRTRGAGCAASAMPDSSSKTPSLDESPQPRWPGRLVRGGG